MTHYEYTQTQKNLPTPCTAAAMTFGGRCMNCGYAPVGSSAVDPAADQHPFLARCTACGETLEFGDATHDEGYLYCPACAAIENIVERVS